MSKKQIEDSIRNSLEVYFRDLKGVSPDNVYDMIVGIVEKPMLEVVLQHARNNQSRSARWLGVNRNTLRKKMEAHGLMK